jgi:hypothetical protein
VEFSSVDCVKGNNARTFSFDIYTEDDSDNVPIIATGSFTENSFGAFQIVYNGFSGVIGLTAYSGHYFPPTGKTINDGIWHKVVVTYDGVTLRIYVDGQLDNESTTWDVQSTASMAETMNTQGKAVLLGKSGPVKEFMAETMNTGTSNTIYFGRSLWEPPKKNWKGQLRNVRFYNGQVSNMAISV